MMLSNKINKEPGNAACYYFLKKEFSCLLGEALCEGSTQESPSYENRPSWT